MAKGQVTISRYTSSQGEGGVTVEFVDSASATRFAKITLSLKDFAMCITGLAYVDGELETRNLDRIGKTLEAKTETITAEHFHGDKIQRETLVKKVQVLEVDGWKARVEDIDNHHNWKGGRVGVSFFRYV